MIQAAMVTCWPLLISEGLKVVDTRASEILRAVPNPACPACRLLPPAMVPLLAPSRVGSAESMEGLGAGDCPTVPLKSYKTMVLVPMATGPLGS